MSNRKKHPKLHLESSPEIFRMHAALENDGFAQALKIAKRLMKRHPDDPAFYGVASKCQIEVGLPKEAERLLRSALQRFPDDGLLLHNLGVALIELDRPQEAETHFRKAIQVTPLRSVRDRAQTYCLLGEALWIQARRNEALAAWQEALQECPDHEDAKQYLRDYVNEYGEPKAPSKAFDDLYHFYSIQKARYFGERNRKDFESVAEANAVLAVMQGSWNEQIAPRAKELETMTAAEKTALFSSITIDFTKEPKENAPPPILPPRGNTDGSLQPTPEELALMEAFDSAFPFLPPGGGGLTVLYGLPALVATGFREQRLKQFIKGKAKATPDEQQILEWASDLVSTIMDAVETEDTEEQVQLMLDATEIAARKLPGYAVSGVVREIRDFILHGLPSVDELQRRTKR
jgi:tetratricopeptide (TPR) repeat protein